MPNRINHVFFVAITVSIISCTEKNEHTMQQSDAELKRIDTLLRDPQYNKQMADVLEAAYYAGEGKPVPGKDDSIIDVRARQEKIATNLSGFYALECGLGYLCSKSGEAPVVWLQRITTGKADSATIFVLNRFANATWKAAQPFRNISRIRRATFTVANLLTHDEIIKDYYQVANAAAKLLPYLQDVSDSSAGVQWQLIKMLMQDKDFSVAMADALYQGYYMRRNETVPPFLVPADDTVVIPKPAAEQRVARNVAGFYALECGLAYFAAVKHVLPSVMLQEIIDDKTTGNDKLLLMRFANATWQSGQPFQELDRITAPGFVPFDLLPQAEKEKDMLQLKAAAIKLLKDIKQ